MRSIQQPKSSGTGPSVAARWGSHGFPTPPGGDGLGTRNWTLDVGGIGQQVFFSGEEEARRWISFEVGPEQMDPKGEHGKMGGTRLDAGPPDMIVCVF